MWWDRVLTTVSAQICSLMRGGIAERGGVRVGHRIIEINGQSVVATAHEKIVQALSNSVGEVRPEAPGESLPSVPPAQPAREGQHQTWGVGGTSAGSGRGGGRPQPLSRWQIHMKTMPAAMFRLLTGQETPLYI